MPTLEMPFTFIFCDFEDLNIAECYAPGRFFAFVAKTQMTKWGEMRPPFCHKPKNESFQNQKQIMPNERLYQRMKKTHKHSCEKTSSSGVIYV